MAKREKTNPEHYVDNAKFSAAVVEYVQDLKDSKRIGSNRPPPIVPNYIAECFLKIARRLASRSNFYSYTYKEEMIMDAVENCLKAIENYNIEAATRTGKPNAFAYFTQISWYAFLRRIAKEKKQQNIKMKYISNAGLEILAEINTDDKTQQSVTASFVDGLRSRMDKTKVYVTEDDMVKQEEHIDFSTDSGLKKLL